MREESPITLPRTVFFLRLTSNEPSAKNGALFHGFLLDMPTNEKYMASTINRLERA